MDRRIGVYICHCGLNIAATIDPKEVAEYASSLRGVVIARDYQFMCSTPGQEFILNDIKENKLNRVVVASCSPLMHERTFRRACREGGINPYLFEMANIREQCSWVHDDGATEKAKDLVRAAVMKVYNHVPLEPMEASINPNTLIIGGGIAGIQAALDIANAGYKVFLVEREPSIGGHMLQFDKTFPTLDCAACIGTPKMNDVGAHPNIALLTYSEVEEVSGYIGNFKVKIKKKPRYVDLEKCTGCGDCATVCPVERPSEWDEGLAMRKAIYRSFPQAVPISYVIEKSGTAPCKATCPAHVSIQGYVALINQGKFREALELFKEAHPFPAICGRVCHHPCEAVCSRGDVDQPIAIRYLHRFLADLDLSMESQYIPEVKEKREEKVAVIGAGPSGLTAAYCLVREGYGVTVFEKLPIKGGMMAVGIPEYRMPRDILAAEIKVIEDMGVEIRTGVTFGEDITLEGLKNDGYQATYLAIGLHLSRKLNVEGEDLPGVLMGVDFLRNVSLGNEVSLGKKLIVIGGGNVAIDAARTALRKGTQKIFLVCLEKREEMPAWDYEIEEAVEEDITILNSLGPRKILARGGKVSGVEFKRCTAVFDQEGAFNPQYDETDLTSIAADTVIVAIGQAADLSSVKKEGIPITDWGGLDADPLTFQTPIDGIFVGGDVFYGPKSVVEAVECGKEAAESIHRYLNGQDLREGRVKDWSYEKPDMKGVEHAPRIAMRHLGPEERKRDFKEVAFGFTEEEAKAEAGRCLECSVCSECYQCVKACEPKAIDHDMAPEEQEIEVGSIIISTGYDIMDPTPMKQFGYGTYPNVLTSLEFERLNNSTGPTGGQILLKNGQPPQSVAIIHCVGSRDKNFHEYCSRVCCMYALKFAHLIKQKTDADVYQMYIDMRCFGEGYEEFYERLSTEDGIKFIRGKASRVTDRALTDEEKGKLTVCLEDTLTSSLLRVPVDMVVLCNALEPRADTEKMSRILSIGRRGDGFFMERHVKLDPITTMNDGVFIAGCCEGPKDITDTVAQAKAAASEVLSLLARGRVEIEPIIASVDEESCSGCGLCEMMCVYGALSLAEPERTMTVNEALCKGCGACASTCPSGAVSLNHFTFRQILDEVEALA